LSKKKDWFGRFQFLFFPRFSFLILFCRLSSFFPRNWGKGRNTKEKKKERGSTDKKNQPRFCQASQNEAFGKWEKKTGFSQPFLAPLGCWFLAFPFLTFWLELQQKEKNGTVS